MNSFNLSAKLKCLVNTIVKNKTIILIGPPASSSRLKYLFKVCGATDVFSYNPSLSSHHATIYNEMIYWNNLLEHPTCHLLSFLDMVDEENEAFVYAGSFQNKSSIAGRQIIGFRTQKWFNLERKDFQLKFLENQSGYTQWIYSHSKISSAVERFPKNVQIVLSGIPKIGLATGSFHNYIANTDNTTKLLEIDKILGKTCDKIKIANFINGTPITIYGYSDGMNLSFFPPVEALVYFDIKGKIIAPGILAPFQGSDIALLQIRKAAMITASAIVKETIYKGIFGIDGVLSNEGEFIIHEFNPRVCAGCKWVDTYYLNQISCTLIDLVLKMGYEHDTISDLISEIRPKNEINVIIWEDKSLEVDFNRLYLNSEDFNESYEVLSKLVLNHFSERFNWTSIKYLN